MEVGNGRRICRENSPERERGKSQSSRRSVIRPSFRKVQVVYYLSRNGQLEHPHYMEVTHLAHQQLRLKDVIDRLTILRGRGLPSLYSWSCKRSYKNGYVWNDLAENDFICPSEGAEYVLKGSEIIEGSTEKFQQLQSPQLRNTCQQIQESNFLPKRKSVGSKRHTEAEIVQNNVHYLDENIEEEYEEKSSYSTSSTTPNSTCSRGVCTDDQNELIQPITRKNPTDLTHTNSLSPPSAISSSLSDKPINNEITNTSKRFEDGDPVASESLLSRNSVLFQLISCGGSVSFRGKTEPTIVKQPPPSPPCTVVVARKSSSSSSASFHKGVLCKVAAKNLEMNEVEEIKYMSENPRFGNLQSEEKEYFSGSIVESMTMEERTAQVGPHLKKSSSYNEERSSKAGLRVVAEAEDEELKKEKAVKGKCIPRKKSSSKQSRK
ncbi:protein SOSEKI 2-like [Nicotiana tabacum]|uniref:Protein SOSEKI 2-like n=2 Tax=Nicotiana TaxID=4085 RepID=A0A1S4BTY0_TOBAC|nr:PREDICTED: protein UPSTREAM OF FLC [Nicotiana sylvestris]XP_016492278.1 PREDICTED: protein UPSTREAM OF FLC-like [Nicotiana tabacum]